MKGHSFGHGKGDVCKKCGRVHISPIKSRPKKLREHWSRVVKDKWENDEAFVDKMLIALRTKERRDKISIGNKGRKVSKETREKLRIAIIGKKSTEKTKRKLLLL